jgi:hypothetical protein
MMTHNITSCTAFEGNRSLASGELVAVVRIVKDLIDDGKVFSVLIFNDLTSELLEVDFRGTIDDVLKRIEPAALGKEVNNEPVGMVADAHSVQAKSRQGLIPKDVTLLSRHWEWLGSQPGGASVALRKLVDDARRINIEKDFLRNSRQVVYRFMHAMAGDLPGFEEASRALFAGDPEKFFDRVVLWPEDIRDHVRKISADAFAA